MRDSFNTGDATDKQVSVFLQVVQRSGCGKSTHVELLRSSDFQRSAMMRKWPGAPGACRGIAKVPWDSKVVSCCCKGFPWQGLPKDDQGPSKDGELCISAALGAHIVEPAQ